MVKGCWLDVWVRSRRSWWWMDNGIMAVEGAVRRKNIFGLEGQEVWAAGEDTGSCTLCVIGEVLCGSMCGRV